MNYRFFHLPVSMFGKEDWAGAERVVAMFGAIVALVILAGAYGCDRSADIDEVGLLNPPYMYAYHGTLGYPIYGYPETMVVHPPVNTWMIGFLWRHGLSLYYAEAAVPVLLLLAGILAIVRAPFGAVFKLALLFALALPFARAAEIGMTVFGSRPETHVYAAWMLGLVLLEWGRVGGWRPGKLFWGSFFLTYAAGTHYYALPAMGGPVIYMAWAAWRLGWRKALRPAAAVAMGGCAFGIPYLCLFVIPNLRDIAAFIALSQGGGGVPEAVHRQLEIYRYLGANLPGVPWVSWPLSAGVPLLLISTALLAFAPAARGVAMAALPLEACVLLFARHKLGTYCVHEVMIYAVVVITLVVTAAAAVWHRAHPRSARGLALPLAAILLTAILVGNNATLRAAQFSLKPRVHEMEIARSAMREIVGPSARIAGRLALWYASGGKYWFNVTPDLYWNEHFSLDPGKYYGVFDAMAESQHMSDSTSNDSRKTLGTAYRDGVLNLRTFYLGESTELKFVLLSPTAPAVLSGYGMRRGALYRFDQEEHGNYDLVAVSCPSGPAIERFYHGAPFSSMIYLPAPKPEQPAAGWLVTAIRNHLDNAPPLAPGCQTVLSRRMTMTLADADAMVARLRRTDEPMQFPESLDMLPGYAGVALSSADAPPANATPVPGIIDLPGANVAYPTAVLDRRDGTEITTPKGVGAFGLSIPIHNGDRIGRCWIHIRASVENGRIGFGVWNPARQQFLSQQPAIYRTSAPADVYLPVTSLKGAESVIVFGGLAHFTSAVKIYEAEVLTAADDGKTQKAELPRVR
jgi:hypothetical protein